MWFVGQYSMEANDIRESLGSRFTKDQSPLSLHMWWKHTDIFTNPRFICCSTTSFFQADLRISCNSLCFEGFHEPLLLKCYIYEVVKDILFKYFLFRSHPFSELCSRHWDNYIDANLNSVQAEEEVLQEMEYVYFYFWNKSHYL